MCISGISVFYCFNFRYIKDAIVPEAEFETFGVINSLILKNILHSYTIALLISWESRMLPDFIFQIRSVWSLLVYYMYAETRPSHHVVSFPCTVLSIYVGAPL